MFGIFTRLSSSPQNNLVLLAVTHHSPTPTLSPWQLLIYFLSVRICLFWIFKIMELYNMRPFVFNIFYLACFHYFIHVLACIRTSCLFCSSFMAQHVKFLALSLQQLRLLLWCGPGTSTCHGHGQNFFFFFFFFFLAFCVF